MGQVAAGLAAPAVTAALITPLRRPSECPLWLVTQLGCAITFGLCGCVLLYRGMENSDSVVPLEDVWNAKYDRLRNLTQEFSTLADDYHPKQRYANWREHCLDVPLTYTPAFGSCRGMAPERPAYAGTSALMWRAGLEMSPARSVFASVPTHGG